MADNKETQLQECLKTALADKAATEVTLSDIFDYLVASEEWILILIGHITNPVGPQPPNPKSGSLEFGLVLYWLDNPPAEIQKLMNENKLFGDAWLLLQLVAPKTKITVGDYQVLINQVESGGAVAEDGTIFGTATYEQLDPYWALAVVNYSMNLTDLPLIHGFGDNPYYGTLTGSGNSGPLIAIIGDWGTGIYDTHGQTIPSQEIMAQVRALKPAPDYIIHLGDVYYAGTDWRPLPGEEQDNLLNVWGSSAPKTAFTLNSNHEMYGAASGYFDVALGSGSPFVHQNQTSYFCLNYDPWVILGLDSAYYSDAANGDHLYMEGAIGDDSHTQQADWIKSLNIKSSQKIIVMTHHNPIDYTGAPATSPTLLNQVIKALGRIPAFWYWGHVHLGAVYNPNAACEPIAGRCVGHSAIPFGVPWGLKETNTTFYYSKTVNTKIPGGIRALNGFMTIQLNANGTVTEKVYEQGNPNHVWPK